MDMKVTPDWGTRNPKIEPSTTARTYNVAARERYLCALESLASNLENAAQHLGGISDDVRELLATLRKEVRS